MNETLINCDLDVQNAIKTIPQDDENCAIYLRGVVIPEGDGYICDSHTIVSGKTEALCTTLLNTIADDEVFRALTFDAILNYFIDNPETGEEFIGHLKTLAGND